MIMQAKIANLLRRLASLVVVLAVAALFMMPLRPGQSAAEAQAGGAKKGEQKPMAPAIEQPGFAEAIQQVDIYPRIAGFVSEVRVDIGDHVKKGQLLTKLFAPELKQELKAKQAMVQKAETGLTQAKQAAQESAAAVERSKAQVDQAKAALVQSEASVQRWNAEYERTKKLLAHSIVDSATVDELVTQLKAAQAAVQQARAKVTAAEAAQKEAVARHEQRNTAITSAQADHEAAQAEAAKVSDLLDAAEVRAPFDGVVIRRSAVTGELVGPNLIPKAQPMFTVAAVDRVRVVVNVPECDTVRVTKGMQATIRFEALDGQVVKGTVTRSAQALDAKSRTMRVEIELPNPDAKILPGMFGHVTLSPAAAPGAKEEGAQPAQEPQPAEETATVLKKRLVLAEKGYRTAANQFGEIKRPRPGVNVLVIRPDEVYHWSVRWLRADHEINPKQADRLAALEKHLTRMKELQSKVDSMVPEYLPTTVGFDAEWYRLEAELWLSQAKMKK
jgi:HlyD family secretion protein